MVELIGVVVEGEGGGAKADPPALRLDRCEFAARPGEVLGLVGPTGCGKSSALAVASGALRPDRGRILLDGRDVTRRPERLRAVSGAVMGGCPGPAELGVEGWLGFWAEMDGVDRGVRGERIAEQIELMGLHACARRPVGALSTGERARLATARLRVRRPQIYLLDGPDEGVDGDGLRRISDAVRTAAAEGATVLLASAWPYFPASVCDRALHLVAGAVHDEHTRTASGFQDAIAAAQGWNP